MGYELDQELLDRFRQIGRKMRKGKSPGRLSSCAGDDGSQAKPPMHRELILAILSSSGGTASQKSIAAELCVSPSTLSEMLNKLIADGFVEKAPDPQDRRVSLVSLTAKGRARVSEIQREHDREVAGLFESLDDDDKKELIRIIDKMVG